MLQLAQLASLPSDFLNLGFAFFVPYFNVGIGIRYPQFDLVKAVSCILYESLRIEDTVA